MKRAFTLIEMLIVLAILGFLAALLFPVVSRARESGRRSSCLSNQRQVVAAMQMYVQDYSRLPTGSQSENVGYVSLNCFQPYTKSREIIFCPTDEFSGLFYTRAVPTSSSLLPSAQTVISYCLRHTKQKNSLYYLKDAENIQYLDDDYVTSRWDGSAKVIHGSQTRDWLYVNGKWKPREMSFADPRPDALQEVRFPGEDWPLNFG